MLARYGSAADARGLVDELTLRVEALRAVSSELSKSRAICS
jgi:hypothetical protein